MQQNGAEPRNLRSMARFGAWKLSKHPTHPTTCRRQCPCWASHSSPVRDSSPPVAAPGFVAKKIDTNHRSASRRRVRQVFWKVLSLHQNRRAMGDRRSARHCHWKILGSNWQPVARSTIPASDRQVFSNPSSRPPAGNRELDGVYAVGLQNGLLWIRPPTANSWPLGVFTDQPQTIDISVSMIRRHRICTVTAPVFRPATQLLTLLVQILHFLTPSIC